MSEAKYTNEQERIITCTNKPVAVSAGAGSGKTFTLTQRIVSALKSTEADKRDIASIDQVMAITYTEKAAGELRDRIKAELARQGMPDEAMKCENAWISTIHGAASRILHENAFEFGIDPGFQIISGFEADFLYEQAYECVLAAISNYGQNAEGPKGSVGVNFYASAVPEAKRSGAAELCTEIRDAEGVTSDTFENCIPAGQSLDNMVALCKNLLRTQKETSQNKYSRSVKSDIDAIVQRVNAMPNGFGGLEVARPKASPSQIMREMFDLVNEFIDVAQTWKKSTKTTDAALDQAQNAQTRISDWLQNSNNQSWENATFDAQRFSEVICAVPSLTPTFNKGDHDNLEFYEYYRSTFRRLFLEAQTSVEYANNLALIFLARCVISVFAELKGNTNFDNNDLLFRCAQELKRHPEVAQKYRQKFKMIMIDEFQDTDKLQLSMIKSICAPDLSNLCTVGDAQQSIYGFRGADVNVFFEFCEEMSILNPDAKKELSKNFRSHPDILKFVAKIFSQPCVFGNNFLNLTPPDDYIAPVDVFDVANTPRIQLDMIHYAKGSAHEALLLSANNMATHIAELIEKGENAGDFAIILKKMSNASVYAQALLDKGIECSIVSGSIFSKTQEAQLVLNLLSVAVNTQDENALFNILVSPLFNISDDALLALTHKPAENGRFKHQPLSSGFAQMPNATIAALTEPDAQALCLAHESLTEFISLCRRGHTSWALRNLLNQTGYLHRLEKLSVPGRSIAANLAKAISIIEDYEQSNAGIAHLRKMFEMHLQTEKETPGSLVASNSNFVQIITAHSSKGLEFPHVCIADYEGSIAKLPSFVAENVQQNTLVAAFDKLSAPDTTVNNIFKEQYAEYDFPQLDQAKTPAEIYLALSDLNLASQVSELQRLFYVSLTRAKKSIYISARAMLTKKLLDDPYSSSSQILTNNMFTALEWEISNSPVCACDFGGSAPAIVKICEFSPNDADEKDANNQTLEGESAVQTFEVKSHAQPQMPYLNPISLFREDVESYSSISKKTSKNAEGVTCEDEIFDNPFSLGLAFHKISERAIIDMNIKGTLGQLTCPNDEFVSRIASKYALTQGQISRLKAALDLWFNSNAIKEFANFGNLSAEVPYMFELKNAPSSLFIEGEIDALALDENNNAMFLDYKTGGSKDENIEDLRQAHLFQAQCYAYALLEQGCKSVQAKFVRVEHKAANGIDPQIIEYNFTQDEVVTLENQLVTQAIRL